MKEMRIVVQLYTDESKITDGIFVENYLADNYYNTIVFNELDFRKYESIIRELELQLCVSPEELVIDFDNKTITNHFGSCSFMNFGNGAKLLFCYVYFSELFKRDPEENNKLIFDFTSCGNNVLKFLFDFMDNPLLLNYQK